MTRKLRHSGALAMFLAVGALVVLGVVGVAADDAVTVAIRNWDYDTLDPHISDFTQVTWMVKCYTDVLVRQGDDGSFYPGLAESWEASEGGKVWVFNLRPGVTFHDGTPWNADALIRNIDRILDPATRSKRFATVFEDITAYEEVDELTVRLTFAEAKPTFLQIVADPLYGWLSPTAFEDPANRATHEKLVGTGPWVLAREDYQSRVVFERNPDYTWGPEYRSHQGPPAIETLIWRFIPEAETRLAALQVGEIDFMDEVPMEQVQNLQAHQDFEVLIQARAGMAQQHHLNVQKPPTDELAVRQAINYATDQEALVDSLFFGVYFPVYGPLMQASPYYNPEVENYYPYDPEKAVQLLEDAGWTLGRDGVRQKDGQRLEVEFVSFPGYMAEAPAEMVQAMLAEVGIRLNITVTTGAEMMSSCAMHPSVWHSCVVGSSGMDIVSRMYWFAHSAQIGVGRNFPKFDDPYMDALIETAMTTTDEAEREAAAKEYQIIWVENALSNPLFAIASVYGFNESRIQDVKIHIGGSPVFYDASIVE